MEIGLCVGEIYVFQFNITKHYNFFNYFICNKKVFMFYNVLRFSIKSTLFNKFMALFLLIYKNLIL